MTSRRSPADIAVRAPSGNLIAAVEVKNRMELTPDIAPEFRRNIVVHSDLGIAPYFLLVSQDYGYAWRQHAGSNPSDAPDATFSMSSVVARYAGEQPPSTRLRGFQLEIVVYQWLLDVTVGIIAADDQAALALGDIGLIEALQGATVSLESMLESIR